MDISEIADATDDMIKSLALLIELAHYTLVIYGVRSDWDKRKACKQPIATWLMSIACCFGGGIILSIAVGRPALTPLANTQSVIYMTLVWWHVFYFPRDVFYSILSWKPVLLVVVVLKEMIRTRKIIKGVKLGRAVFPDSLLLCTVLGMLGACGGGFVKNTAAFIRNKWDHQSVKSLYFSPITKLSLLFSLLYNLQLRDEILITFNTVVLMQFVTLSLFSVGMKIGFNGDPFRPFEKVITSLAVDYEAYTLGVQLEEETTEDKGKAGSTDRRRRARSSYVKED